MRKQDAAPPSSQPASPRAPRPIVHHRTHHHGMCHIFNFSFEIPTMETYQIVLLILFVLFVIWGLCDDALEDVREREVRQQARNEDLIRFRRERRERERESSTGRRPTELDRSPLGPRRGRPSVRSGRSSSRPACSPALWSTATRSGPLPCC